MSSPQAGSEGNAARTMLRLLLAVDIATHITAPASTTRLAITFRVGLLLLLAILASTPPLLLLLRILLWEFVSVAGFAISFVSTLGGFQRLVLGSTPPSCRWMFLIVSNVFTSFSTEQ